MALLTVYIIVFKIWPTVQKDYSSAQFFEDLVRGFQGFYQKRLKTQGGPMLVFSDNKILSPIFSKTLPSSRVSLFAAPYPSFLPTSPSKQIQNLIVKTTKPPFTASFDHIFLCILNPQTHSPADVLKEWAGCLTPQGRLFFFMLGEMTFYEWFVESLLTYKQIGTFLTQRSLFGMEDFNITTCEEWIRLEYPNASTLREFLKTILKDLDLQSGRPLRMQLRDLERLPHLTLHIIYGEIVPALSED